MFIKKIKRYSYLGTTLGGLTVVFCSLYNSIFMKYLDAKLMVGILAIIAAIQALFSNLIYKNKKYYPEDRQTIKIFQITRSLFVCRSEIIHNP